MKVLGFVVAIGEALAEIYAFLARFGPLLVRFGAGVKRAALGLGQLIKANAKNLAIQLAIAGGALALSSKDIDELKSMLSEIEAQIKDLESNTSLSTQGPSGNSDDINKLRNLRDKLKSRVAELEKSRSQGSRGASPGGDLNGVMIPIPKGVKKRPANTGSTTDDGEPATADPTAAAAPLGEALTVLQKKLEEGLCPAIKGLTDKLGKVPDPGLMLGALTAPAAMGVASDAFAGLPDSARRYVDEGAMASMTVGALFVAAADGADSARMAIRKRCCGPSLSPKKSIYPRTSPNLLR